MTADVRVAVVPAATASVGVTPSTTAPAESTSLMSYLVVAIVSDCARVTAVTAAAVVPSITLSVPTRPFVVAMNL